MAVNDILSIYTLAKAAKSPGTFSCRTLINGQLHIYTGLFCCSGTFGIDVNAVILFLIQKPVTPLTAVCAQSVGQYHAAAFTPSRAKCRLGEPVP